MEGVVLGRPRHSMTGERVVVVRDAGVWVRGQNAKNRPKGISNTATSGRRSCISAGSPIEIDTAHSGSISLSRRDAYRQLDGPGHEPKPPSSSPVVGPRQREVVGSGAFRVFSPDQSSSGDLVRVAR